MTLNRYLILYIVFGIFLLSGIVSSLFQENGSKTEVTAPLPTTEKLSVKAYDVLKDELINITETNGVQDAFFLLKERAKTNEEISRMCHSLVHEIGRTAYKKYADFGEAVKFQDEICNSGYLHGVIESHFSRKINLSTLMNDTCAHYPLGRYISWQCFHGVGHGVMFATSNDLPKSVALCETYTHAFARTNCLNGVYMENFNTDQKLHPSTFLKKDDLFYPCQEQSPANKNICYLYAPTNYLHSYRDDYIGALKWCTGAEFFSRDACAMGVGSQAMKEHIQNPQFVERICMSGNSSQISPCIRGMIGLYINHYGTIKDAQALCPQLNAKNYDSCVSAITASADLFATP